ncbi:MAG: glycosyl transferase family protein [Maritimibacter sp.]
MTAPHPFSRFVAILGRGKTKQRHLTLEESREAMAMILRGDALPEQIGAFLMLLRLKEEAPEEIAGFALGTQDTWARPKGMIRAELDWSSYAGKRVQLPWYILSIMALVNAGIRVSMHGTEGHTPGRIYTQPTLKALGIASASSFEEGAGQLEEHGFAFLPLEVMSPKLQDLINLRPVFGLRSPVHSFTRMLNPYEAPTVMQGIFHRGFMDIHAGAARLLNIEHCAVFRGDGGEIERRPNKPTQVWTTQGSAEPEVETWQQVLDEGHAPPDPEMHIERLMDVWQGDKSDLYALNAVVGTMAIALKTMGRAPTMSAAETLATEIWDARHKPHLPVGR